MAHHSCPAIAPIILRVLSRPVLMLALGLACAGAGIAAEGGPPLQDKPRVFICAHSFMTFIAQLLPPMASAAGVGFDLVGHQMIGGSQVIQHWELGGDKAKPALRAGSVDALFLSPHVKLPDQGIDNYVRLGIAANPRLRVLVQASWPAFDGTEFADLAALRRHTAQFRNAQRDQATEADIDRLRAGQEKQWTSVLKEQVRKLNAEIGHEAVRVVPVNEAVYALRTRIIQGTAPGLTRQTQLFNDDIGHPSPPLTILVAYCHFAALYHRDPAGLPVPEVLKRDGRGEELNRLLQQLAWQAVSPAPAP